MANPLDRLNPVHRQEGADFVATEATIPVTVGLGTRILMPLLWLTGVIPAALCLALKTHYVVFIAFLLIGTIPGIIFQVKKVKADSYFKQLSAAINDASAEYEIYIEHKAELLGSKTLIDVLGSSINLDKDFIDIAAARSGLAKGSASADAINDYAQKVDRLARNINIALERYPELRAHADISAVMQQVASATRNITAARARANDLVHRWNIEIFNWPINRLVAAQNHYTTMTGFLVSAKARADATMGYFGGDA